MKSIDILLLVILFQSILHNTFWQDIFKYFTYITQKYCIAFINWFEYDVLDHNQQNTIVPLRFETLQLFIKNVIDFLRFTKVGKTE